MAKFLGIIYFIFLPAISLHGQNGDRFYTNFLVSFLDNCNNKYEILDTKMLAGARKESIAGLVDVDNETFKAFRNHLSGSKELVKQQLIVYYRKTMLIESGSPIVRYETYRIGAVCNDGWVSSSTGSGTCSHHGGVNYWKIRSDKKLHWIDTRSPEKIKSENEFAEFKAKMTVDIWSNWNR
jgi:hypothetical protein